MLHASSATTRMERILNGMLNADIIVIDEIYSALNSFFSAFKFLFYHYCCYYYYSVGIIFATFFSNNDNGVDDTWPYIV